MEENNKRINRREFITVGGKAVIGIGLAGSLIGSAALKAQAWDNPAFFNKKEPKFKTGMEQKPLQYAYNALEPHIDAHTMEIHYTKHAAAYSKNLRDAAKEENVPENTIVEDILGNISKYSSKMRNNAGGHYNHELFWNIMSANPQTAPQGALAKAIDKDFVSFEKFVNAFEEKAKTRFGSGWAWLVLNNGKLEVGSTPNQDNPLMDISDFKGIPLMGIDVWEHAYYLHYQNRRPDYIKNWWKVLDWKKVEERYNLAVK
ncbi:MAG: superoxide dismutase [Bacteroidetes bacterium]|nr:superoxide dismutase [Bacteroidota bacterium]